MYGLLFRVRGIIVCYYVYKIKERKFKNERIYDKGNFRADNR